MLRGVMPCQFNMVAISVSRIKSRRLPRGGRADQRLLRDRLSGPDVVTEAGAAAEDEAEADAEADSSPVGAVETGTWVGTRTPAEAPASATTGPAGFAAPPPAAPAAAAAARAAAFAALLANSPAVLDENEQCGHPAQSRDKKCPTGTSSGAILHPFRYSVRRLLDEGRGGYSRVRTPWAAKALQATMATPRIQVEALETLVTKLKEDPSLVYDPKLAFFKEFVLSWGAKVPEAKPKPKEEPKAPAAEPANEDEEEDEEPEEPEDPDPERLEEDPEPYPPQGPSENCELSDSELDKQGELKQAAAEAQEDGNLAKALEKLTEAFQIGNVSAMMFAKRAELLLKLKRPCACIACRKDWLSSHECGVPNYDAGSHMVSKQQLEEALARFNEVGATSVQSLRPSSLGSEAWKHSFSIAAALLRGIHQHVPRVVRSVEFAEGADCKPYYSKLPSGGRGVVATVCVKLSQKEVYGEIATRSRIGAYVRLGSEVIFAHHEPPTDLSTEPLLLEVYGFDFPVLPETIKLRRHLKQVLGQDYSRKSAAAWYEKHKDEFCPLKDSKLRRILASVFEVHSLMFLPEWAVSRALWGMLNICTLTYIGFEFWDEGKNGIRVTVQSSTPADPDDVECLQFLLPRDQTD
ncbi:TPR repeat-containing thioredoxin TDX [Symbiodinium microadriaticum]|uniref:TPR repeat-containing thioredoxin TDX n=1 Tax=Symbiodinium microadriaticum TaxID=2951 RepID=A0A1Q9EQF1_SYMMI|nr:TPR repeat-containing thioredoxin TDX [Symbiodinium microadriaticum]